jgi:hypothetical protein
LGPLRCLRAKQNTSDLSGCYIVRDWSNHAIEGENNLGPFTTHDIFCFTYMIYNGPQQPDLYIMRFTLRWIDHNASGRVKILHYEHINPTQPSYTSGRERSSNDTKQLLRTHILVVSIQPCVKMKVKTLNLS